MAFHLYEDVLETTTTSGTGDLVLNGAVTGWRTFASQYTNGDTCFYSAYDGTNFEHGIGTYNSAANSISRTTVLRSTNSNAAVNFSGAQKVIGVAPLGVTLEQLLTPGSVGSPRKTGNAAWSFDAPGQFANTTQTNDNASTGNLGEYLTVLGVSTQLTNASAAYANLALTAGDWEVSAALLVTLDAIAARTYNFSIDTTTGAAYAWPNDGAAVQINSFTNFVSMTITAQVGPRRVSLGATGSVFLNAKCSNPTTTTVTAFLRARRVR